MIAELIGASVAVIYGALTAFRRKTLLFYRITALAALTCLMGSVYTALYTHILGADSTGFHVGRLGAVGMFFFLHSAYYGAYDSLTDSTLPSNRKYRIIAAVSAVAFFAVCSWMIVMQRCWWQLFMLVPATFTLYFAVKHLLIPDVEMGVIRVMRGYNAIIIALCLMMMLSRLAEGTTVGLAGSIGTGIALAAYLPAARNGVRKWFM